MDDIGLLGFETSKDLYEKLKSDFNVLKENISNSNYLNFILDANHLKEWIEKDDSLAKEVKQKMYLFEDTETFKIINDLANRGKHFTRHKEIRKDPPSKDEFKQGFNWANFSWDKFTWGGTEYNVEYHGRPVNLLNECEKTFIAYKDMFEPNVKDNDKE